MKYKRNNSFLLKEIAGDHMLIARGTDMIDFSAVILFNETGVFLWQSMAEARSPQELAELLVQKYEADYSTALTDVEVFLNKSLAEGFVLKEED